MSDLKEHILATLEDPKFIEHANNLLYSSYVYGLNTGLKGLPLRWHSGLKLRGTRFILSKNPEIKEAKQGVLDYAKQLASILFRKPNPTRIDVLHLFALIGFITYEIQVEEKTSTDPMEALKIERKVTTMSMAHADKFLQRELSKPVNPDAKEGEELKFELDTAKYQKQMKAVQTVLEEVLDARGRGEYYIPFVTFKAGGKGVTKHKTAVNAKTPLTYAPSLMLLGYVKGLREHIGNNIANIYYTKGNQQLRKQVVTFNPEYIEKVYGDNPYVTDSFKEALLKDKIKEANYGKEGEMPNEFMYHDVYLWSGIWRVADFGASPLDISPERYISLLRIARVTKAPFDLDEFKRFTYVDLSETLNYFTKAFDRKCVESTSEAMEIAKALAKIYKWGEEVTLGEIPTYVAFQDKQGTMFRRQLHLYLVANPELFPDYTGIAQVGSNVTSVDESSLPVNEVVVDGDLDLDNLVLEDIE